MIQYSEASELGKDFTKYLEKQGVEYRHFIFLGSCDDKLCFRVGDDYLNNKTFYIDNFVDYLNRLGRSYAFEYELEGCILTYYIMEKSIKTNVKNSIKIVNGKPVYGCKFEDIPYTNSL